MKLTPNGRAGCTVAVVALCSFMGRAAAAQSHIGILAGPTASRLAGSFVDDSEGSEVGVNFRVTFDSRLVGSVWLATGISILQKGGKKVSLSGSSETYGFRSMYLQVPLLVRPQFQIAESPWFIAPFAGAGIALNVSCNIKPGDQFEFDEECGESMPGGDPRGIELSIPIGAELWRSFPGGSKFVFEVRYDVGVSNTLRQGDDLGLSARNNIFTAMFGFALPLYADPQ